MKELQYKPMATLSFLPGPAMALAQLEESVARQVLDTVRNGVITFDRREPYRSLAGVDVQLSCTRLPGSDLDIGVCTANNDLVILALESKVSWEYLVHRADLASLQSTCIGPVDLVNTTPHQVLRMLHAYMDQTNSVARARPREAMTPRRVLGARNLRRWRSTQARQEFRDLLDSAISEPQIVDRDGVDVVVIGRDLLDAYERPKSAPELAAYFEKRAQSQPHPLQPLSTERPEHFPRAPFTLPDLQ